MSLTRNLKLTGRAASTQLREQREWIMEEQRKYQEAEFHKKCDTAMDQLRALDPDGWDEWFEDQPNHTLDIILARVEELKEINELVELARGIRSTMRDSIQTVQMKKSEYALVMYADSLAHAESYKIHPPSDKGNWVSWSIESAKWYLNQARMFLNTEYTG